MLSNTENCPSSFSINYQMFRDVNSSLTSYSRSPCFVHFNHLPGARLQYVTRLVVMEAIALALICALARLTGEGKIVESPFAGRIVRMEAYA